MGIPDKAKNALFRARQPLSRIVVGWAKALLLPQPDSNDLEMRTMVSDLAGDSIRYKRSEWIPLNRSGKSGDRDGLGQWSRI